MNEFSAVDFYLISGLTGGVISSLVLLVGHYFPWQKLLGQPLGRLQSYTYGSVACWLGFSYWRYFGAADWITPAGLIMIYAVSGLTVWGAYRLDAAGQTRTVKRRQANGTKENVTIR